MHRILGDRDILRCVIAVLYDHHRSRDTQRLPPKPKGAAGLGAIFRHRPSGERHDVSNTPHTGTGASQHGFTTVWCDPAAAGSASVNVSGQGTPEHRKVPGRPSCGGRASGKKNRSGNSSTCSKAREGFPVKVGALTDRAAYGPHTSPFAREEVQAGAAVPARTNEPNRERAGWGKLVLPRSTG
jgi:hypothetical protein